MERTLRLAVLVVTAAVALGTNGAARHAAVRPPAPPVRVDPVLLVGAMPLELNGRVERWQNARLLAAEAAARAAAARPPGRPPAPAPATYPAGSIQDLITRIFTPYGPTAVAWGLRVARCESGYNPGAYNPAGPYYGLFQFLLSTFRATPYGSQDIYDPVANASAAAWKYAQGGAGAWGCK